MLQALLFYPPYLFFFLYYQLQLGGEDMMEFLKQPGVYECAFFFAGIIMYAFLSRMLKVAHMYRYIKNLNLDIYEPKYNARHAYYPTHLAVKSSQPQ